MEGRKPNNWGEKPQFVARTIPTKVGQPVRSFVMNSLSNSDEALILKFREDYEVVQKDFIEKGSITGQEAEELVQALVKKNCQVLEKYHLVMVPGGSTFGLANSYNFKGKVKDKEF
mmetsp:Transcript_44101/g.50749  ORF Transcript_44101/g.50749 Transcript_44101/m.50749 type:complete len:116 (+) Transcript_44101:32-379(+)